MVGLPWHKRDHSARYDETRRISMLAKGMLSDLVDTMYRTGKPLAYDIAYLCHVCAVRDKRQIDKPLQELIDAGLIVLENGMLSNPVAMTGIEEANRHISNGKKGGRPAKKVAQPEDERAITDPSVPDRFPITERTQVVSIEENQSLSRKAIDEDKKKNPPPTPSPGRNGGGGGSDIDRVIAGFDLMLVDHFGESERRKKPAANDRTTAGQWLDEANGSVDVVLGSIKAVMARDTGDAPGSLARYCNSVPKEIRDYNKPATLTAGTSSRNGRQQASANQGVELWVTALHAAGKNDHDDIFDRLKHLGLTDTVAANEFAKSIMEIVSRKKAMAAA